MWMRRILLALLVMAVGAFGACEKSAEDSPFEGSWLAEDGSRITFSGSSWFDSEGDAGEFEFTGEYPEYTVTFLTAGRSFRRRAIFADTRTMELCAFFPDGAVGDCIDLVLDRPTLH